MKKLITLLFTTALMLFSVLVQAQDIQKGNPGMWPAFVKYGATAPAFSKTSITMIDANGKTASLLNGIVKNVEKDAIGVDHYRYQQTYNGMAIENADMLVHVANGKIKSQNGKWVKDFPAGLPSSAAINETGALNKALQDIGAKKYKWQIPAEEAFIKREQNDARATFYPKATLVYYSGERDVIPSALRLAYKFDIYAQDPVSRQLVFVDAVNGKILGKRELIHEANRNATAYTAYSGIQTIVTDRVNSTLYRLRETGRGNGINTYNLQKGTNYGAAVDFTDNNTTWNNVNANQDEYATDAHWATEKTYDYFFQKYGRNSIDNNGMALNSYLHYSSNYFNAFWDGSRMTYGDGDAAHGNKPLTALDVCGHEITHGITERTSALVYSYESGAMNEGFSDIFGTSIEAFARPGNTDWLIGGDFFTIRNMSNPNAFSHPDTYQGTYWYTGSGDNGGVHFNSGVLNYWFYLLTTGGTGVNDHNFSYSVGGIGMNNAAAIAYRLNTVYLVSTSTYNDARILGIQAAEDLYGVNSNEAIQTANAWSAVGLYASNCPATNGLTATNVLDRSATLKWTAEPGAVYYQVQFKANSYPYWSTLTTVTADSINIGNLTHSTLYDWRVRSSCNQTFSNAQFTTAVPDCISPTGVYAVPGSSSAQILWSPAAYSVSYDVEYKLTTDNNWTVAGNTTGTSYAITGLTAPTTYDCRVKTNCGFGTSGYVEFQFTTTLTPCDPPTGLVFTYNNNVSTFTWDPVPGAVNYVFELDWAGGNYGLYDDIATTNSYDMTGLMQGGNFQFRVTTNCGNGYSLPSSTTLFSTPCSAPGSLSATNITTNSATLNWVPAQVNNNNTAYSAAYRLANTNNAWTTLPNTSASSVNISGLLPGTEYQWKVKKLCTYFNGPEVFGNFTTLQIPCAAIPAGLNSTNITNTTATVNWGTVPGAVTYNLQYKTASATNWTTVTALSSNSYNLTNLSAGTTYNFQVQAVCASASSSYSAVANFSTYCASSGTNTSDWIDYFSLGGVNRSSGAEPGGYAHTGLNMNLAIGSTSNNGTISAGYTGSTKKQNYAVYIDLNQDGDFDDAGEKVAGQLSTTNGGNFSFNVNIPATATPGLTTLRVVMRRQSTTVTPCMVGNRGETEDYYVNLTGGAFQGFGSNPVTVAEGRSETGILVGPNPSTGIYNLYVNGDFKPVHYAVISVSGLPVKQGSLMLTKQQQIDITAFPSGIYVLRLTDQQGVTRSVKLIKNK
ncbi:MAG: M4 family metallopeptidase [Chitinophagaceae bacterium]|nr:M4 family metallopeptidase [Chitinophagaceae bacterium]